MPFGPMVMIESIDMPTRENKTRIGKSCGCRNNSQHGGVAQVGNREVKLWATSGLEIGWNGRGHVERMTSRESSASEEQPQARKTIVRDRISGRPRRKAGFFNVERLEAGKFLDDHVNVGCARAIEVPSPAPNGRTSSSRTAHCQMEGVTSAGHRRETLRFSGASIIKRGMKFEPRDVGFGCHESSASSWRGERPGRRTRVLHHDITPQPLERSITAVLGLGIYRCREGRAEVDRTLGESAIGTVLLDPHGELRADDRALQGGDIGGPYSQCDRADRAIPRTQSRCQPMSDEQV